MLPCAAGLQGSALTPPPPPLLPHDGCLQAGTGGVPPAQAWQELSSCVAALHGSAVFEHEGVRGAAGAIAGNGAGKDALGGALGSAMDLAKSKTGSLVNSVARTAAGSLVNSVARTASNSIGQMKDSIGSRAVLERSSPFMRELATMRARLSEESSGVPATEVRTVLVPRALVRERPPRSHYILCPCTSHDPARVAPETRNSYSIARTTSPIA